MSRPGKYSYFYIFSYFFPRGDKFRLAYAPLGDIRSVLPSEVNIVAHLQQRQHILHLWLYVIVCQ